MDKWRTTLVAQDQCDGRGEVSARAVAAYCQAVGVDTELLRILGYPTRCGHGVVDRGRKRVLGRDGVIDRDDDAAAGIGQRPAQGVVCIEAAASPSTAVEKDQPGHGSAA